MSTTTRISVAEFDGMIERGEFEDRPNARIELIHGELLEMTPPNPPHDYTIDLLNYWSMDNAPRDEVHVRVQNALGIAEFDSVPEPDVAWMKARSYRDRRPAPADVLLLIEVSDTSLRKDRGVKAGLYAEAGVPDYWIVNLNDWCIEVHHQPQDGAYADVETFQMGQSISPLSYLNVKLDVASVFAP